MKVHSYLVIDTYPDIQEAFDAMDQAFISLSEKGYVFMPFQKEVISHDIVQYISVEIEGQAQIKLISDATAAVHYIIVESPLPGETESIVSILESHIFHLSIYDLKRDARQKMVSDPQSLLRLALGTGESIDVETFEIINEGLRNAFPLVRFRAAEGAGIIQWSEFIPELEQLLNNDPIPEVREMSRRALNAIRFK